MADKYGKKPVVRRFKMDKTRPGRIVRKTVVTRRSSSHERKERQMKSMKKGR
jgi:hypothetical protein